MWHGGHFRCLLLAALLAAAGCFTRPAAAQRVSEYQVKAAYLYQFLNFVQWPQGAFRTSEDAFEICLLGNDPFGRDLDRIVEGKQVRGRRVQVQRLGGTAWPNHCHVLFIAVSERPRLSWILDSVARQPLLTVSELREFEEQGGMIRFVVESDNVRLHINPRAANDAGLQISSKLLSVAAVVVKSNGGMP